MAVSLDELPEPTVPPEPEPVEVPPTPPVEPPAPPAVGEPDPPSAKPPPPSAQAVPLYYCLDNNHSWYPKDESRFFGYEGDGCPTCPQCNKQVIAVPVNALGEYPAVVKGA
jgi:hypothetical protein